MTQENRHSKSTDEEVNEVSDNQIDTSEDKKVEPAAGADGDTSDAPVEETGEPGDKRGNLSGADPSDTPVEETGEPDDKPGNPSDVDPSDIPVEETREPGDKPGNPSDADPVTPATSSEAIVSDNGKESDSGEVPVAEDSEKNLSEPDTAADVTVENAASQADVDPGSDTSEDASGKGKADEKDSLESEHDLKEKDDDDDDEDEEEEDFAHMSKEELVDVIKELSHSPNVIKAESKARTVKHFFDEMRFRERDKALKAFLSEGGEEADFSYRPDELTQRFDANYQLIRDRKQHYQKDREKQKEDNLIRKQDILEKLREFVDSEETNISFDTFKKFQEEWKSIGPVPGAHARTLWANYNALIDRFYDNRSIYYELKELDRKKNLTSKYELCERAEKLAEETQINEAVKELNELHHEFKHIGPVPKEEQEAVWLRFKAASDAVYERRKEFVEKLKSELDENLAKKLALSDEVQAFSSFDSDRIKAWNEKTKGILDLQKRWDAIGGLPRAHAKETNKKFWTAFKTFFSNKNHFFKKLDAEREKNLETKRKMVEEARELQQSTDFQSTADKLKQLQRDWREVGPVPGKYRESIYKEFKEACDTFFNRKRAKQDAASEEYVENLKKKREICKNIEALIKESGDTMEKFQDLQDEFNAIGFVPKRNISEIKDVYAKAVDKYIASLDNLEEDEKERLKIENEVSDILNSPNADQKLYRKEQSIRKQIHTIENDIAVWKNNLEFFNDSKTANKLKDEFQTKIDSASDELQHLKQQLRIIRTAS